VKSPAVWDVSPCRLVNRYQYSIYANLVLLGLKYGGSTVWRNVGNSLSVSSQKT